MGLLPVLCYYLQTKLFTLLSASWPHAYICIANKNKIWWKYSLQVLIRNQIIILHIPHPLGIFKNFLTPLLHLVSLVWYYPLHRLYFLRSDCQRTSLCLCVCATSCPLAPTPVRSRRLSPAPRGGRAGTRCPWAGCPAGSAERAHNSQTQRGS